MNLALTQSRESILNSAKVYEERNMTALHATILQIYNRVDNFSKAKQQNTLKENMIAQQLFATIREAEL